ncbi:MAG TPA: malto-oligosyltrehalose synthase [Trueperaceae bacterium]
MIATYRLQLTPDFGFSQVQQHLPYFRRLGVSHLYLSPITEAVSGSSHGYDVIDHNSVRAQFGGREGFESLRRAAHAEGLGLLLDIVPNHAGVGPHNEAWQDLLAYGPESPHAKTFDVDWDPPKAELRGKLLLPFLGRPYGEALDEGEIRVEFADGYFHAVYFDNRFRLSPASYAPLLEAILPALERQQRYFDLLELQGLYADLLPPDRERAEALKGRLEQALGGLDIEKPLGRFEGSELHELLERQYWRLAYWKTAGDEINYRRFFDVNGLVALRMEEPSVFLESHRLVGELLLEEGVHGVRVDHVDGLVDPHSYLDSLSALGARNIWVEKIVAPGETLPLEWPVAGSTGYEFMNDVLRLLIQPAGEEPLRQSYRQFSEDSSSYAEVVVESKRLVMGTSLSAELTRLTNQLYRISERDYHTRDFTLSALRSALMDVIAAFGRYRTYLPHDRDEAEQVLTLAVSEAKRLAQNTETTVHDFVLACLIGERDGALERLRSSFLGRFQQYTAPVAAKGVEDTAFYRFVPLAALNEVGGEPDHFTVEAQAFHSRARFRQHRYPHNLLATATHDHKRGEDTRMRLAVLSELSEEWQETLARLDELSGRRLRESTGLGGPRVSATERYLLYQHLLALWDGEQPATLAPRLEEYMRKAVREAKQQSSWIDPDERYEAAVVELVGKTVCDPEIAHLVEPLAGRLARFGFANSISQLVLKLTTPGVPDIYQGTELPDLSLVDPDNRRPVDFEKRKLMLDQITRPDALPLREWLSTCDPRLKLFALHRLLSLRAEHPALLEGSYRPLEARELLPEEVASHLIAFVREAGEEQLLVLVPRFLATLERSGGWGATVLRAPVDLVGDDWTEVLGRKQVVLSDATELREIPFLPAVLYRRRPADASEVRT